MAIPSLLQRVIMRLDDMISKNTHERFDRYELECYKDTNCYFNEGGKISNEQCNDDNNYGKAFQVSHHGEILQDHLKLAGDVDFRKN